MTDIEQLVERMESAAKAATPGPWCSYDFMGSGDYHWLVGPTREYHDRIANVNAFPIHGDDMEANGVKNAAHMSLANPQNVLTIIAEWRAQKAEIEKLREVGIALLAVMEFCDEDPFFTDDEGVSCSKDADGNIVDDPLTFGHIRRFRKALETG